MAAAEGDDEVMRAERRFCIAGSSWDATDGSPEERASFPTEMAEMEVEGTKGKTLEATHLEAAEGSLAREAISPFAVPMTADIWVPARAWRMLGSAP